MSYSSILPNCSAQTCLNGGFCQNGKCKCAPGFYGEGCWSNQCLTQEEMHTETNGLIKSSGAEAYTGLSTNCLWSLLPPKSHGVLLHKPSLEGIRLDISVFDTEPHSEIVNIYVFYNASITDRAFADSVKLLTNLKTRCSSEGDCQNDGDCVNGTCICEEEWVGGRCQIPKTHLFPNAERLIIEFVKDLSNIKKHQGFEIMFSGIYPCFSDDTGCGTNGTCFIGECKCSEGFYGSPCVKIPTACDLVDEGDYHYFNQREYGKDKNLWGVVMLMSLMLLISLALLGTIFIYICKTTFLALQPSIKKQESIRNTLSNKIAIVGTLFEFLLIVQSCLSAKVSWLSSTSSTAQIISSIGLDFGDLFVFIYAWIFVIILWCFYCIVYIFKVDNFVSQWWIGEVVLNPGLMYLQTVGTVGILPSVGSVMSLFSCAFLPLLDSIVLAQFCTRECFSTLHITLTMLGGVLLLFFIPLVVFTCHFWREMNEELTIIFKRNYVFFNQIFFFALIYLETFLTVFPYAFLSSMIAVLVGRAVYIKYVGDIVSVPWLSIWIQMQNISATLVCFIMLITHILDIRSSTIPLVLVGLIVLVSAGRNTNVYMEEVS